MQKFVDPSNPFTPKFKIGILQKVDNFDRKILAPRLSTALTIKSISFQLTLSKLDSSIRLLKPLTCIYGLKSEIHFARAIALDFPTSLHSNMNCRLRFEVSIKSSSKIHNLPLLHILIKAAYFANSHPEAPAPINAILN